jgi:ribosomal protein S18 acetylase RimI-like enzyme
VLFIHSHISGGPYLVIEGTELEIRAFTNDDRDAVINLWQVVFPEAPAWNVPAEDIERKLTEQRELFLVAQVDDRLVGTVMGGYDGHRGWVYYLAVHPNKRRRGIGTALMEEVEVRLGEMECPKVNLQVRASNEVVVAFYEKLGYDIEARVSMGKRLIDRPIDE